MMIMLSKWQRILQMILGEKKLCVHVIFLDVHSMINRTLLNDLNE